MKPDETQNEKTTPTFETGFMLLKTLEGNWHVLTDITSPVKLNREAAVNEIRQGAAEAVHSISQQQLAALIITALLPNPNSTMEE